MNTRLLSAVAIAAFLIGISIGILADRLILILESANHNPVPVHNLTNINAILFNSSQYYPASYLISGNASLSASGNVATSGFNLTKRQLQNGSILYIFDFFDYGNIYAVTINSSDSLYFIDTNLADDAHGFDSSIGDDGYLVVNSTGYITKVVYPLPGA